jgi:hypothetical protein
MSDLEEERQADRDDPTIPETKEETVLEAKDRTAPKSEAGDEEDAGGQQQQRNGKFGTQVLAGEIQKDDPHGYNPITFE